jgi:hypothetical protein
LTLLSQEQLEAEWHGHPAGVADRDQRPQEAVPVADEGEHGEHGERRGSDRDEDTQDAKVSTPVELGGLLQFLGYGEEKLSQQDVPNAVNAHGRISALYPADLFQALLH